MRFELTLVTLVAFSLAVFFFAPPARTAPRTWAPKSGDRWVAVEGNDANPGTRAKPLKTLPAAIAKVSAGQTIWVKGGTHPYASTITITKPGTADKPFRISGTAGSRPVLDFQALRNLPERGFELYSDHWHIRNLEIKNAGDNCVYISGSHNTLEHVAVHDCGDTGIQLSAHKDVVPSHNKILNCDSYLNFDNPGNGENADGFAAKIKIGPGNEFRGCRAWQNADDGWDFFESQEVVVLENCWAFDTKHPNSTSASDGNGFKLGGRRKKGPVNSAHHRLGRCFAFHNPAMGFDRNNNSGTITCTNCGAWKNGKGAFEAGIVHTGDVTLSVTPEKARNAKRDKSGNLPAIEAL